MAVSRGINVLVVEDSAADAKLMNLWLGRSPAVRGLQFAASGGEALAILRAGREADEKDQPGLVLLDANLPDMTGWEVLAELNQDLGTIRPAVMMLSGSSSPADERRAGELGAIGFYLKPFDASDFAELVERVEAFAATRKSQKS